MKLIFSFCILFFVNLSYGQTKYEKDFNEFWEDIHNNYAYLNQQQINWKKVKQIYLPQVTKIDNTSSFIQLLERVIHELHNGHISLNTNLNTSNKIIPRGQDIFVEKINNRFFITDLRKGFGAELSGLKIGHEIVLFNDRPITAQIEKFLPQYTSNYTNEMYQYAINMLFAGTHNTKRIITINENGKQKSFYPDDIEMSKTTTLLDTKILNETTGYIKINNSLGNSNLILAFDQAIDKWMHLQNLVIDLTETPNGGNTTVARCIMGRFIQKEMPYQKHEFDEQDFQTKRSWREYVTPRKTQFKGKLFVIVGRWTGSMGEGIAIGFDGLKRAKIIGTKMAGLLGAINGFTMSETNIGFQIPTERLYHINGTPREKFIPTIHTKNIETTIQRMLEIK